MGTNDILCWHALKPCIHYIILVVSPVFLYHKFHSTICPYSSQLPAAVIVREAWSSSILVIHWPLKQGKVTRFLSEIQELLSVSQHDHCYYYLRFCSEWQLDIKLFIFYLLTSPGTYNSNASGSDACTRSNSLDQNTRQNTRASLPECVVSTTSGPLPETIQDRTQT